MKKKYGFTICVVLFALAFFAGWVMNINSLVHAGLEHPTVLMVLRCIGIFIPPLGGVLGYF